MSNKMNFNNSLSRSIAFSTPYISVKRLSKLPQNRFKAYARKTQKAYYRAKRAFERSNLSDSNHLSILTNYEVAHARWSDMKEASKMRLFNN